MFYSINFPEGKPVTLETLPEQVLVLVHDHFAQEQALPAGDLDLTPKNFLFRRFDYMLRVQRDATRGTLLLLPRFNKCSGHYEKDRKRSDASLQRNMEGNTMSARPIQNYFNCDADPLSAVIYDGKQVGFFAVADHIDDGHAFAKDIPAPQARGLDVFEGKPLPE